MTREEEIRAMVRRVVYRAVGKSPPGPGRDRERRLVTESDVGRIAPGERLEIGHGALVTPLARQAALERHVRLVESAPRGAAEAGQHPDPGHSAPGTRVVALGADHGGFAFKQMLKEDLTGRGYAVLDCGTEGTDSVDYPDFALAVAQLVADGRAWRGILVDGAGIGSCMAANKVPGIRAAMCYDEATAVNSRAHNDANVLTLGAGMIGQELGRHIVTRWLDTPAEGGRHARRVGKIMDIERRFARRG